MFLACSDFRCVVILRTNDLEVASREKRGEGRCGRYWIAIAQWDDNLNEFRNNIK